MPVPSLITGIVHEVLDEAWNRYGDYPYLPAENDADFEEFVVEKLLERGAKGVVWYTSTPNCRFVVNFGGRFFDVDYVSYEIVELDVEDAIQRATWGVWNEDLAKEYLGVLL